MKIETLTWTNKETGKQYREQRIEMNPFAGYSNVWLSLLDGRYYTKGVIGWMDITTRIKNLESEAESAFFKSHPELNP